MAAHSASGAEGQMVHLLGEGTHHVGWLHGYGVVHGWRNHSTLWVGTNQHTHTEEKTTEVRPHGKGNYYLFSSMSG